MGIKGSLLATCGTDLLASSVLITKSNEALLNY